MEASAGRPPIASEVDRSGIVLDVLSLGAIAAIALGLGFLSAGPLGFDRARAIDGVASQLATTLPAAVSVLLATTLELAAGLALARLALRRRFDDVAEALLFGFVAAVLKDVALLGILGQVGLFSQPILLVLDVAIVALVAFPGRSRAIVVPSVLELPLPTGPVLALILVVWSGALVLQLASPVVPFLDVLPNHVAPAEHLRVFGGLDPLTATQSPIYGPSRSFLGYSAFVGALTTMTGLPAALAAAAFILPSTVLVAAGVVRLASALAGARIGTWALVTFALTASFARLTDARATVVVLPLAAWALATLADHLRDRSTRDADGSAIGPLLPGGVILGLGLGAAILVHPVIGALAVATVAIVALAFPERAGRIGLVGSTTAVVVGLPQAATMLAIPLPAIAAFLAIPVAIGVGVGLDALAIVHRPLLLLGRVVAVGAGIVGVVFAGPLADGLATGIAPLVATMEVSLAVVAVGIALRASGLRSPVLLAALGAGVFVAAVTRLVPSGSGMLGDAILYEIPKTLQYWVPVFVSVAAAISLDRLWSHRDLPLAIRATILASFLAAAALPIRTTPIDVLHLGEHRFSETLAIDLRFADRGYWLGYPDTRRIVDPPRRDLLAAVRSEIEAGRLHADTPVLHVAASFQQWVATPLGVFAGVTETDVTPDAEVSIHTVGGRLRPMADLSGLLASRAYPYLLLEPSTKLPSGVRDAIASADYRSIFSNGQGELFALAAR